MINIFQPALGAEELAAIAKVFESNWIGKGNSTLEFEKAFAASLRTSPDNFTSTTCCTEGLFLASQIFGFSAQDEVIAPSISFVAVGSAIVSSGAKLVLCDVDARSLNVTAEDIARVITPRTKAIYLNHYGGVPCEMDSIMSLCSEKGIIVIEDAACAIRSFYKKKACGTFGDMGVWSFDAMKTLCTGDGGMLWFKSLEYLAQAKEQLYLGLPNRQKSGMDSSAGGNANWWEYEVERPGRRAIMNNITGAIGVEQLKKLDTFLSRRRAIYERYCEELADISAITLPPELTPGVESSYYFFWIQTARRDELARYLLENKVYTTFRYWPLHRVEFFGQKNAHLPKSDLVASQTLNIPLHQSLSDSDVEKVIDLIKSFKW